MKVLDNWKIRDKIQGLVFDTTSSNTGIHRGACVCIEEALDRELVNIACSHHVMEVILSSDILVTITKTITITKKIFITITK